MTASPSLLSNGWIKLHRQALENGWLRNPRLWAFWCYCLLKASHKQITVIVGRQKVSLDPGQFVFGRQQAAADLGMSEQEIRTSKSTLKSTGNLTIKATNKFSIITVVNWNTYQHIEGTEQPTNQPAKHQQINQQTNHIQEVKEVKPSCAKKTDRMADFELFWNAFAYKKGKGGAEKSWLAIKNYSPDLLGKILDAAKKEAANRPAILAKGLTPKMAQGWITERRWEDEQPTNATQTDDMGFYR